MSFFSSSRLRVGLTLSALALVCVAGGLVIGFAIGTKHERNRGNPATWNLQVMKGLRWKLKPDAAQDKALQAIVDRAAASVQSTREQALNQANTTIDVLISELKKELHPDQITGFDELMKSRGKATVDMLKVEAVKAKDKAKK